MKRLLLRTFTAVLMVGEGNSVLHRKGVRLERGQSFSSFGQNQQKIAYLPITLLASLLKPVHSPKQWQIGCQ